MKALIFDVDGTLAETEELHRRAFNLAFAYHELDWHWDRPDYGRLLKTTGGKERIAAFVREDLCQDPDPALIARLHEVKTACYRQLFARGGLCLRPGIGDLIASARHAGLLLAVATTTTLSNVAGLCECCFGQPLEEVFDVVAAGDEVATKKPAPDVYELALRRLGLEARDCCALEDSRNGLLAARGAGLRCIVSPGRYTRHETFREADLVVPEFSDSAVARWLGTGGFPGQVREAFHGTSIEPESSRH